MELKYRGGNSIEIVTKKATFVVDGASHQTGLKIIRPKSAAVFIATQPEFNPAPGENDVSIDGPGEYEVHDLSAKGIAATRMLDHDDVKRSTVYRLVIDGLAIAVVGHINGPLDDDALEQLGVIDIIVVPIGGNGYTLDAHQAVAIVRQVDPKVVIPTHYADTAVKYEVPQDDLDIFVKELGAPHESMPSLKIKNAAIPDSLTLISLTRA